MINLVNDTIDKADLEALSEWVLSNPRLTKGPLTVAFEEAFAKWLGTKYAVFVNSGSSANLLMIYALIDQGILNPFDEDKNKVVVPALSWATDLSPVIQFGLDPILCDCNLEDLSVDLNHLETIFKKQNPQALILVSVLGLVPNMAQIVELCDKYNVVLLEDVCESLGSKFKGKNLGTFGKMSSTSFYYGHHISTIEGGMVFTDCDETYNLLLSLRSHGWSRDWSQSYRAAQEEAHGITGINSLYTFYHPGFNLRSTDLQAFLGLRQLTKLPVIINKRAANYQLFMDLLLTDWKPKLKPDCLVSSFAIPVISTERDQLIAALISKGIETRPLIAGSMAKQPMYTKLFTDDTKNWNASIIHKNGLYVPNHPGLVRKDIKTICEVINSV